MNKADHTVTSATSNCMKLVHWALMGGLLHLVYSEEGPGRAVPNVTSYYSMWHSSHYTVTTERAKRSGSTDTAQTEVRPHHQQHPRSTALAAHSAALGVHNLSADFQVFSPDSTSLP